MQFNMMDRWQRFGRIGLTVLLSLGAMSVVLGSFADGRASSERGPNSSAETTIRYVAPAGEDTANSCTNPAGPCATLQHAIDQAAAGEEIRLAQGTFTALTEVDGINQIGYIDTSLTIRGGYAPADFSQSFPLTQTTILDAESLGRGLVITGSVTAVIENLTIQNGNAAGQGGADTGDGCGDAGGAIFGQNAVITLSNNVVQNSLACEGGGIFIAGSPGAVLQNNQIKGNQAFDVGGGIHVSGGSGVQLLNNTIVQNTAKQNLAASGQKHCGGGSIFNNAGAQVIGNAIFNNSASNNGGGFCLNTAPYALVQDNLIYNNHRLPGFVGGGAGLIVQSSDFAQITNNVIYQNGGSDPTNLGTLRGGGLHVWLSDNVRIGQNQIFDNVATVGGGLYLADSNGVDLQSNIFRHNFALDMPDREEGFGGAIFAANSQVESANIVIVGNSADVAGMGSGIFLNESVMSLVHPTISSNDPLTGTGIFISDTNATLSLTNAVVVSQALGVDASSGGTAVISDVLWYANGQNTAGTVMVTEEMTANPEFAADGYHLTMFSPAINQANLSSVTSDVDGEPRPACNPFPDLGADERQCYLYFPSVNNPSVDNP